MLARIYLYSKGRIDLKELLQGAPYGVSPTASEERLKILKQTVDKEVKYWKPFFKRFKEQLENLETQSGNL